MGDEMETSIANEEFDAGGKDEDELSSPLPDAAVHYSICGKAMQRR